MFIREMDAFLDTVFHGFWVFPCMFIAFISIVYVAKNNNDLLRQMNDYIRHSSYGFMIIGLICILVFSRLFGMGIIWGNLLEGHYLRTVKNVVEEGTEYFGYAICFIASLFYLLDRHK